LIAAFLLSTTGCTERSPQPPLWLGHVASLSGPDKQVGEAAARGIRLAVEEINKDAEAGLGRQLKVIHSDARGDLGAFESEAVRLVAINRVWFLLGGATQAEAERLDRAGVAVIAPLGARARTISESIYCTGLMPSQQGKALAQFAALELGTDSVAVVSDDRRDDFTEVADVLDREFRAAWLKKDVKTVPVVRRLRLPKDGKAGEFAKALESELAAGDCKALVFAGKPEDLRELGQPPVPILFAGDAGHEPLLAALRGTGKDLYYVTPFVADAEGEGASPAALDFARRYKQAFQEDADVHAALAYENMKLLHQAMLQTKDSLSKEKIRDELVKVKDFAGLAGPLTFTADRQLRRPAFVVRIDDNGAKTVKRYSPEN